MLTPLQLLNGLQTVDLLHVLVTHISPADIFRHIWWYEVNTKASDRIKIKKNTKNTKSVCVWERLPEQHFLFWDDVHLSITENNSSIFTVKAVATFTVTSFALTSSFESIIKSKPR